jgi:hypothetical protein
MTDEPQNCSTASPSFQDYANNPVRTQQSLRQPAHRYSELSFCQASSVNKTSVHWVRRVNSLRIRVEAYFFPSDASWLSPGRSTRSIAYCKKS